MDGMHAPDHKTEFGFVQSRFGLSVHVAYSEMKEAISKELQQEIDRLLNIVAANVQDLMDERYSKEPNKVKALSSNAILGITTIRRLLRGSQEADSGEKPTAATIETLMRIAWAFNVPVWNLMVSKEAQRRVNDPSAAKDLAAREVQPRDLKRKRGRGAT